MQKTLKKIVSILVAMAIVILPLNAVYAVGPGEQMKMRMALVGDSFAGYFYKYDQLHYDIYAFSTGGVNKEGNEELFYNVIANPNYDVIVFSTGVNDHYHKTPISSFEETLDNFAVAAAKKGKFIIVHTYMDYPLSKGVDTTTSIKEYDYILRKVASDNFNVYYIDMSEYQQPKYYLGDQLHYNESFYEALDKKVLDVYNIINTAIYSSAVPSFGGAYMVPGSRQVTD